MNLVECVVCGRIVQMETTVEAKVIFAYGTASNVGYVCADRDLCDSLAREERLAWAGAGFAPHMTRMPPVAHRGTCCQSCGHFPHAANACTSTTHFTRERCGCTEDWRKAVAA